MRTTMGPLTPTTSTLSPAIAHIADVASSLATHVQNPSAPPQVLQPSQQRDSDAEEKRKRQQDTVRWVLGAPGRLRKMIQEGRREEAEKEWEEVRGLLGKWKGKGIEGAEEFRSEVEKVMREIGNGKGEVGT